MDNLVQTPSRASISSRHASPAAPAKLAPPAPMAFPTPYQIGLQQRLLSDAEDRADTRRLELYQQGKQHTPESGQADREHDLANARFHALQELLFTVPANTLADAGVQVCAGLAVVADMEGNELTPYETGQGFRALRRILASILPVVRAASEHPLEAAVDPWALDAPLREFAALESGA